MKIDLIVSRHPAAIDFIRRELRRDAEQDVQAWENALDGAEEGGVPDRGALESGLTDARDSLKHIETIPVVSAVRAADVIGKCVAGVLPMALAARTDEYFTIEFRGDPPRGQEYDLAAMDAAHAVLVPYCVLTGTRQQNRDAVATGMPIGL